MLRYVRPSDGHVRSGRPLAVVSPAGARVNPGHSRSATQSTGLAIPIKTRRKRRLIYPTFPF